MNITPALLSFNTLSLSQYSDMTKAKKEYVTSHAECAICGADKRYSLEVHHQKPVHLFPDLACDFDNFLTLCDRGQACHFKFGHLMDFRTRYNTHIREYAILSRLHISKEYPAKVFKVPTENLIVEFAGAMHLSRDNFMNNVYNLTK